MQQDKYYMINRRLEVLTLNKYACNVVHVYCFAQSYADKIKNENILKNKLSKLHKEELFFEDDIGMTRNEFHV